MAGNYLSAFKYPWEALGGIKRMIIQLGESLPKEEYLEVNENVWVHKSAKIFDSAYLTGPCIIGERSEVRHGAFIRGSVIVGNDCVVGNSAELKNSILFDEVHVPHYNYVGDSILGYRVHLGAGAITSNIKSDKTTVFVHDGKQNINTGLRKFGALIGDNTEIGCNTVLNPGTIIGRNCTIYPLSNVRGVIENNSIYKSAKEIVKKR
ncbi:MAG: UDP-N-acetylglucosamine pyrophosphorylase [Bacilli bacterium]